ncbi:EamA domain-containing membrane protein RarD [Dethiosulfatibacter aminovorans DSM 17477]|uniref:EamA domain-containing membrane protein RarD n=1 Tax=Dethiosulfatibacter aminovorans DSM 17477 TaxID=1121476 RepID=A0A1M6AE65_9FIRM|nr:DMT family transporter [Dethiosulfatibacter aminovorans]SHI34483.1 EamA domain-containing membrane protein RarD [Dethiosulfatibacter aminovorans DSM 17477]
MNNIFLQNKGNILVILSAVLFGSMPLFVKIIDANGGNLVLLTFMRSMISLPLLFMLMRYEGNKSLISLVEFKKIVILSLGFAATPILLLTSYDFIPSGMAMTIHFVYPVFVLIGCFLFFKDKPNRIKTTGLVLSTFGIFLFFDPGQRSNTSGILLAFLSGITYAFYTIYLDKSGLRSLKPFTLGFYLAFVSSVELGMYAFLTDSLENSLNLLGWILCILYSLLITVGASISFQEGVKEIGSQRASILSTFEPITSIVVGILVFSESFGLKTVIGIIMILTAVVILTAFDRKQVTSKSGIKEEYVG